MFSILERPLRKLAIRTALQRPMPERFTPTQDDNFFSIVLQLTESEFPRFRVLELKDNGYQGEMLQNASNKLFCCLPYEREEPSQLFIYHRYGFLNFTYSSALEFIKSRWSLLPQRRWARDEFRTRRELKKLKYHGDRLEVLRSLVNVYVYSNAANSIEAITGEGIDEMDAFTNVYGDIVWSDEKFDFEFRRFHFIISSLKDSGELEGTRTGFTVTGKALATLAEADLSDRRHEDNFEIQTRIVRLTALLTIAALIQAITAVLIYLN